MEKKKSANTDLFSGVVLLYRECHKGFMKTVSLLVAFYAELLYTSVDVTRYGRVIRFSRWHLKTLGF